MQNSSLFFPIMILNNFSLPPSPFLHVKYFYCVPHISYILFSILCLIWLLCRYFLWTYFQITYSFQLWLIIYLVLNFNPCVFNPRISIWFYFMDSTSLWNLPSCPFYWIISVIVTFYLYSIIPILKLLSRSLFLLPALLVWLVLSD